MSDKLYFKSIDGTNCYLLEDHLKDARLEGIAEVTLIEALPDDGTTDFIWCTHYGECVELHLCKKSECPYYESKSGRGRCNNKGHLYLHGEEVTFQVPE